MHCQPGMLIKDFFFIKRTKDVFEGKQKQQKRREAALLVERPEKVQSATANETIIISPTHCVFPIIG